MKKTLKIFGMIIVLIILIVLAGVAFISVKGVPSYPTEDPTYEVVSTPEKLERGLKLSRMLCANCHLNQETGRMSGGRLKDIPTEFGEAHAPNITGHPEFGIGHYSDGQLLYLLRTGIKKDGQYAPPYMPKFPNMSDEDIESVIAFLRSNHPMVQADPTPSVKSKPSLLTKFLCNVVFKPLPFPDQPVAAPDTSNPVAWGKYLAISLDCYACHSADFKTLNIMDPEKTPGYMGGGNTVLNREGKKLKTPNITPHPVTGIGNMSEEAFIKALRFGIRENKPALRYPMIPYSDLSDQEAKAIYRYLMQIPAINNEIAASAGS